MNRRSSRWRGFATGVLLGLVFALPGLWALNQSYGDGGPWPDGEITYFNDTEWQSTLKTAVRQWNRLAFGVRFREVADRDKADLIIEQHADLDCTSCIGQARRIGHASPNHIYLLPPRWPELEGEVNEHYVRTIVHELGHVLGLGHTEIRCAVMNGKERRCPDPPRRFGGPGWVLCGPLRPDLIALEELYGISEPLPERAYCYERERSVSPMPLGLGEGEDETAVLGDGRS